MNEFNSQNCIEFVHSYILRAINIIDSCRFTSINTECYLFFGIFAHHHGLVNRCFKAKCIHFMSLVSLRFHDHPFEHIICIPYRLAGEICNRGNQLFTVKCFELQISLKWVSRYAKYSRFIGLKSPNKARISSTGHNEFISTVLSLQIDNLLNPFAILLCYYSSVIFLRDIFRKNPDKIESNNVPMQPVNSNDFHIELDFSFKLRTRVDYIQKNVLTDCLPKILNRRLK